MVVWLIVFFSIKDKSIRKKMLIVSLWTSLLGLTEPIFVPAYWSPPSLFNLAIRTGFDIESLIFAFGVGGLATVIYERIFNIQYIKVTKEERHKQHHKYHLLALVSSPIVFIILLLFTNINPIYSAVIALIAGGIFTWYCRPDLKKQMFVSAIIFTGIYFVYFLTLLAVAPGYVVSVWNMSALSGILILGIPIEELMFAFSFGFMWSSVYEHVRWYRIVKN